MTNTKSATLAVVAGTLGAGSLSAVATWGALVLPQPWAWGAGAVAAISGIWALVGSIAVAKLATSVASATPDPAPKPEPPQPRPRWEVEPANGFDIDLLPQLQPVEKTLLVRAQDTLTADDPLTQLDLAWILWRCHGLGKPTRAEFVGKRLPSQRRFTRTRYDETVDLLERAGIIVDRGNGYAGKWAPGLTLTEALDAIGIDPETLPILTWEPGYTWPGLARSGTSSLKLLTTRIIEERGSG